VREDRLRALVRERASSQCEYCRLHQEQAPFARFHEEHVVPRSHGGEDIETNLALACDRCNLHKGPNLSGIDPATGEVVPLFHPRAQEWRQHFAPRGAEITGLTPTGRATVRVLNMNAPRRVELRAVLRANGEFT